MPWAHGRRRRRGTGHLCCPVRGIPVSSCPVRARQSLGHLCCPPTRRPRGSADFAAWKNGCHHRSQAIKGCVEALAPQEEGGRASQTRRNEELWRRLIHTSIASDMSAVLITPQDATQDTKFAMFISSISSPQRSGWIRYNCRPPPAVVHGHEIRCQMQLYSPRCRSACRSCTLERGAVEDSPTPTRHGSGTRTARAAQIFQFILQL